ncbi:hypothetical protein ETAA8_45500 [Anatilimnocola aggregata]|uniref:Uncharacterized protein n=1 Tax=Anatilimnocola aggregata TaxID=2528021 RepID=A0A517YGT2_9BACT|nr:hypothetical protein [Anatilimnocola aggregata]QDU29440.1 hypothetical protein ETAA8_45500 [Anatilimnocola aggregata]
MQQLLRALRLWLSERDAVNELRNNLATKIEAASVDYRNTFPTSVAPKPEQWLPHSAAAIGRSLLRDSLAENQVPNECLSPEFSLQLNQLAWGDLMLVAACVLGKEDANRELIRIIDEKIKPALVRRWGRQSAEEITDALPQTLHLKDERGLNQGRPRLLAYGGRARLETWLKALAARQVIDRWRRLRETSEVELDKHSAEAENSNENQDDDLALIREVVPNAFCELMKQLPKASEQQYRFAFYRCVRRWDNTLIAAELNVSKPRVTELSQQVFRRLISIIRQMAPELAKLSDDPSRERRTLWEDAIGEWFGETAPTFSEYADRQFASKI